MVRVLIVDDSPVAAEFLRSMLEADSAIRVVAVARDGEEAITAVERMKPDVITMDIHMPRLNGFDATRTIMETCPTPIVIVSARCNVDHTAARYRKTHGRSQSRSTLARPSSLAAGG
jgi:two-component system chemotaxis response regulator CheB